MKKFPDRSLRQTLLRSALPALILIVGAISAMAETKTIPILPFDKIIAKGAVKVTYSCIPDSAGRAVVESRNANPGVELTVKKGELTVKGSKEWAFTEWPEVRVYSAYIVGISSEENAQVVARLTTTVPDFSANVTGNGVVTVENLDCTTAKASISTGAGKIDIDGNCLSATYNLVGTGAIEASGLRAETVKCNVTGTGSIGCHAVDTLDVRGLGSTKIFYKGSPDIKKTGAAKIFPLSSETWEEDQN